MTAESSGPRARFPVKFSALKPHAATALLITASTLAGLAENWPAWRGAGGSGISRERKLPVRWSTNENVRWRAALPDRGNSTPIIWEDCIFIAQAVESRRTVMCLARRDGKLLWQSGPTWVEKEQTPEDNPPCTPSPVTDGQLVIAWFGSAGVYCYDFDGRELWHRDLGNQSHMWGYASSPALHRNLCFLNFGPGARSFLIALDKQTGRTVWKYELPPFRAGAKWEEFGGEAKYDEKPDALKVSEVAGSWATPLVVRADGHDELVVAFALRLTGFAPNTGAQLWTCDGPNIGAYSSPFFGDGIVALNASGLTNTVVAVRPGGRGDVTATRRLWIQRPGNNKTCLGAGVVYKGHIYQVNMMGFAECRDLKTGDGEPMNASLAVSDGEIFIRTDKGLWCIGAAKRR